MPKMLRILIDKSLKGYAKYLAAQCQIGRPLTQTRHTPAFTSVLPSGSAISARRLRWRSLLPL